MTDQMSQALTETELTEYLDHMGALDQARQPGCYALELQTPPDDAQAVADAWLSNHDVLPPNGFSERLADATRLYYVGSHGKSVYQRLCQHVNGHKSATIMEVWPPVDVAAVWPEENPREMEWNRAAEMASEYARAWSDGELL